MGETEMRTELLFESCPFLTSANVTLSRLGFADGDALWEIMQDEELYRYEYEAPAKERVQAEYKIQDANAQFAAKRTVTLGVYRKHRPRTTSSGGSRSAVRTRA